MLDLLSDELFKMVVLSLRGETNYSLQLLDWCRLKTTDAIDINRHCDAFRQNNRNRRNHITDILNLVLTSKKCRRALSLLDVIHMPYTGHSRNLTLINLSSLRSLCILTYACDTLFLAALPNLKELTVAYITGSLVFSVTNESLTSLRLTTQKLPSDVIAKAVTCFHPLRNLRELTCMSSEMQDVRDMSALTSLRAMRIPKLSQLNYSVLRHLTLGMKYATHEMIKELFSDGAKKFPSLTSLEIIDAWDDNCIDIQLPSSLTSLVMHADDDFNMDMNLSNCTNLKDMCLIGISNQMNSLDLFETTVTNLTFKNIQNDETAVFLDKEKLPKGIISVTIEDSDCDGESYAGARIPDTLSELNIAGCSFTSDCMMNLIPFASIIKHTPLTVLQSRLRGDDYNHNFTL
jgi:hypothetical protein